MHFFRQSLGLALACGAFASFPGNAAINASQLGATYNANHSAIAFKVYSSRATRIAVTSEPAPVGRVVRGAFLVPTTAASMLTSMNSAIATAITR